LTTARAQKSVPGELRGTSTDEGDHVMSRILVTGTSSGFGYETAVALAERGHTVFATMRGTSTKNSGPATNLETLASQKGLALKVLELDVTSDASVAAAVASAGALDVVVNNAGSAVAGFAEASTSQQLLAQLDTNVVGMHRINRAVLPAMRERRSGLLIHMSSAFGRTVSPFVGVYTATKWAIEALAEAYRYELKLSGVDVSIVQPGAFPTPGLKENLQPSDDGARAAGYAALADGPEMLAKGLAKMFKLPNAHNPREVADAIVGLVEKPAGTRPARVIVDRFDGENVRELNDAHAKIQRSLLVGMGLSALAD
jgi:NAD(P)-dependent dehydrogenase (short-subunit alcohol dehydrogenase family)